jgi:hypothetical protein
MSPMIHTLPVLATPNQCGFSLFTLSPTADKSFGIKKLHLKKQLAQKIQTPSLTSKWEI